MRRIFKTVTLIFFCFVLVMGILTVREFTMARQFPMTAPDTVASELKPNTDDIRLKFENDDFVFEWLVRPNWNNVHRFSEGRAWAQKEKRGPWTLFDTEGTIIKDNFPARDVLFYEGGLAKFRNEDFTQGFVNISGDIAIPGIYLSNGVDGYGDGLVHVRTKDGHGFTDTRGEMVIPPQFEDAWDFSDGRARVKKDGKWGYIDKKGKWAVPPQFDKIVSAFSEGLAYVEKGGKLGYIDKDGKTAIDYIFDGADSFKNGVAFVSIHGLWGMIDKRGSFLVEPQFEDYVFRPGNTNTFGLYGLVKEGKVGFFDVNGKLVIDFKYKYNYPDPAEAKKKVNLYFQSFENGLAIVILDEPELRFAVIDTQGEIVFKLPPNSRVNSVFPGDYLAAGVGGRTCLFDRKGKMYDITDYIAPEFNGKGFYLEPTKDNIFSVGRENPDQNGYFKITPKGAAKDGD